MLSKSKIRPKLTIRLKFKTKSTFLLINFCLNMYLIPIILVKLFNGLDMLLFVGIIKAFYLLYQLQIYLFQLLLCEVNGIIRIYMAILNKEKL